ncbi:gamma-glutamyltransferase [Candidatus Palauibacter polyketidifaciens]|uniref:gamma-glutamyltransferase n=1 Tax=Candidatus Palauibacter polyketidifaciens TaxID=3056740 RepID=UPI0023888295|nr:gamma-glutamyltransferase [Candidatus Palauibacter polyketidifaciens]MDE2719567.1 gamma-glutamyltransferase [Candidatus Palauibacter polyketidifaciens]
MKPGIRMYGTTVLAILAFAAVPLRLDAQSAPQVARSADGVVVAAQPLAAAAGARMLELGGNAADAAVAAAFAISVVEPSMNSIGGRNQILIRTPDGGVTGIDGTTSVPLGYDPATAPRAAYGYPTVGVPGSVAGLMRLHEEYGSLPLTTIMAPAIDYAAHGFRLLPGEARRQAGSRDQVAESEGARRYYLKADGSPYRPGDRLVQSDMAETLRTISLGGGDAFYRGEIAGRIADDMAANGGFLTREALAAYEAEDSRIVRGSYRGFEIVGSDIPASGAIAILALQVAEVFDPGSMSDEAWASVVAQSLAVAMTEYRRPSSDSSAARVTSKAFARQLAEQVRVPVEAAIESGTESWAASGAASRAEGPWLAVGAPVPGLPPEDGHTTHLSAADGNGMAIALTQTIGPGMGAKVATPGLGFLYAVTLGGYLGISEPGERARSGITPFMVLDDGEPFLVLGAAGGIRIISAVVQAVTRVIDDGLALPAALAAPRVHPDMGPDGLAGFSVEAGPEDGWSGASVEEFREMGFEITPTPRQGAFGRIHGLQYDAATRTWIGAADPDWEGAAVAPRPAGPTGGRD